MAIELYYSPYCDACADSRLLAAAEQHGVIVKNVTEHLSEAAGLRIVQPPALVIDGRVVAQGAATLRQLTKLVTTGWQWTRMR